MVSVEDVQMTSLSSGERRRSTSMTLTALQFVRSEKGQVERLQRRHAHLSAAYDELLRCAENAK